MEAIERQSPSEPTTQTVSCTMTSAPASAIPLTEVLPWSINVGRNILVYDTIETDGRFLCYLLASQVLPQTSSSVYWVEGGPVTATLIQSGLRKLSMASKESIKIKSVPVEILERLAVDDQRKDQDLDVKEYIQGLYTDIAEWGQNNEPTEHTKWIVLDDVSSLSALIGQRLTYAFCVSVQALANQHNLGCMIRCGGFDPKSSTNLSHDMVGAGGSTYMHTNDDENVHWESALAESADGIVDVVPLASGYSRHAHGRLIFTERHRGWGKKCLAPVFHYYIAEKQVLAIRVR